MYSEEIIRRIAICGGFFSLKMFPEGTAGTLRKYITRNDIAEVISTGRRQRTGYLYKVNDRILGRYYDPDARRKSRVLTLAGEKEFQKRVSDYMKENTRDSRISHNYRKEWYKDIYEEVVSDKRFSAGTGYVISDYKIFVCFTRLLASLDFGYTIIPRKEEKAFRLENGLIGHREISTGITFGYSHSRKRVVILVSDFMKSEKHLIRILEYYNRPEFLVLIYTFRPAEIFEKRIRSKFLRESGLLPEVKVVNNAFLNEFFGE